MQWNATPTPDSASQTLESSRPALHHFQRRSGKKGSQLNLKLVSKVTSLRRSNPALLDGKYVPLNEDDKNIWLIFRSYKNQNVLVLINMSDSQQKVKLDLAAKGIKGTSAKTLAASFNAPATATLNEVTVEPYSAWIAAVQ